MTAAGAARTPGAAAASNATTAPKDEHRAPQPHQAVFGFTNMRPRISMCSAWQNHWQ